ncbi:haloacid dehalogenase type II [Pseudonocardia sp.]|uniref:haloacid dehalogenase type II n=1 Tax=Pseudonocardia sp. TaxID=60912 RepID=UPI00261CC060|nr:haloacid dehalogenase type II [Pseudonocardia sp.]
MTTWSRPSQAVGLFVRGRTARTAAPVALVVGTILSAVNQGDVLLAGAGPGTWVRVAVNYLVPFCVASLGFLSARRVPADGATERDPVPNRSGDDPGRRGCGQDPGGNLYPPAPRRKDSPVPHRPHTVAFDVVETLISLEPLHDRFVDVGLPGPAWQRWFDRMLRDGMALTLAGDYAPFPEVAASALRVIGGGRLSDDDVAHVLDGFATLPAQPDAEQAMQVLTEAGISVTCLTNGARESTEAFLGRSGLDRFVDQVISVAEVRMWKPPRAVYDHALARIGRPAADVALVAVHAFDCHGAHAAGLTTGWAARLERHYAEIFTRADVIGDDLVDVARALAALPAPA